MLGLELVVINTTEQKRIIHMEPRQGKILQRMLKELMSQIDRSLLGNWNQKFHVFRWSDLYFALNRTLKLAKTKVEITSA